MATQILKATQFFSKVHLRCGRVMRVALIVTPSLLSTAIKRVAFHRAPFRRIRNAPRPTIRSQTILLLPAYKTRRFTLPNTDLGVAHVIALVKSDAIRPVLSAMCAAAIRRVERIQIVWVVAAAPAPQCRRCVVGGAPVQHGTNE